MSGALAGASQAIDSLLQSADPAAWTASYQTLMTSEFRQVTSKDDYERLGSTIQNRLGKLVSKGNTSFFVKSMNGVVSIEATYDAQFEKGKGTIRCRLRKNGEKWMFLSFFVSSPELLDVATLPCKSCGKPYPKDATFCPACGKKIDAAVAPLPGK